MQIGFDRLFDVEAKANNARFLMIDREDHLLQAFIETSINDDKIHRAIR